MTTPLAHFAIPVRNVGPWLNDALQSLQAQTEPRWTATIVDDDSEDETGEIAKAWAAREPRMQVVQQGRLGLVGALNRAVEDRGTVPFVARFDGDDLCHPHRLERQIKFLSNHPKVDVLDSRFSLGEPDECVLGGMLRYRDWHDSIESHEDFKREFLVENPVCHPASIVRAATLERVTSTQSLYREGDFPEDYDLWLRLLRAGARFHKLAERLVVWRDRPTRSTRTDPVYRRDAFFTVKWSHLQQQLNLGAERLVVWGAKKGGKPWIRALSHAGHPPVAVVDIDPKAIGSTRHGIPVVSPDELAATDPDRVLIAVGSSGARQLIEAKLNELDLASIAVVGFT